MIRSATVAGLHRSRRPAAVLRRLATMLVLRRQRNLLAQLDDHLLFDIGLSRQDAQAEAERPLWDVPAHWRG